MTLVIFDLCDTLYATNTTVGFVRDVAQRTGRRDIGATIDRWTSRRTVWHLIQGLSYRLLGRDVARRAIVAGLKGFTQSELDHWAEDYATSVLPQIANGVLHERLRTHRQQGDRVVILSNSLEPVVAAVAKRLDVDHRASTLAFESGRSLGRIDRDLTGRKHRVVDELLQSDEPLWVYTDNRSDWALIEHADRAIVVLPKGTNERHWAGEDHDYLAL